ncbi:MAG: polysaccharide pyruvyl transferase CsaB [Candidatus Melainabacteria bacterium]|nr:polysaccharide pyruvyl transferase CsaB [Candidatus Melainabacteria bacterium]
MAVFVRQLIVVSGYYGFNNLGDEAILEELVRELKSLWPAKDIVILSQNPETTAARFGVRAQNRWQLSEIAALLRNCKLFISGGGGLFQDSESVKSVIYYGGLISLATLCGAPTLIYAQGLGPLKSALGKALTRFSLVQPKQISVRDETSLNLLKAWGLAGVSKLTGDPVWLLSKAELEQNLLEPILSCKRSGQKLVGLSLRDGGGFSLRHIECLAIAMHKQLSPKYSLVPLPLQANQDEKPLQQFQSIWLELGGKLVKPDLLRIEKPSQWLSLIANLDLLVGMRLHSLIMALSSQVPVVGISYDPKVKHVLEYFEQPSLPYETETQVDQQAWEATLAGQADLGQPGRRIIAERLAAAREGACQNQALIAKMLSS